MIKEQQENLIYIRDLIQSLQKSTIQGSAITLCLLPNKNINEYNSLISNQIHQAANIKDKVNKNSVIEGLKSIKEKFKSIKIVPQNGLIVLVGNVLFDGSHIYNKIVEIIQPPKPITKQVYSCGKNFNFKHINQQILVNNETIGFIIVDGSSALYATLKGSHKQILKQLKSDIMRNHNKGGSSSNRFARIREHSVYNFVKIACQQANKVFLNVKQITGFVIAGSADIKNAFIENQLLNPQIKNKIINVIDIAQSSQQGLKLAISQSKQIILNVQVSKDRQIIEQFFQQMRINDQKVTNGYQSVIQLVQMAIAQKVICLNNIQKDKKQYIEEICRKNNCKLVYVSNINQIGCVFQKNFGGIAAILRYQFDYGHLKQAMQQQQTGFNQNQQFFL